MYQMRYVGGHVQVYDFRGNFLFSADTEWDVQVYDFRGNFLFSADTEWEAREELKEYEESAA